MKDPLELNPDFAHALEVLENSQRHLFITGRAGTGKSTLLQLFKNTTRKEYVVLAPTGIAALNVGGQTLHSFFGFPAKFLQPSDIKKRRDTRLYKKLKVLIIDEISMVRADMLDHIDLFLRLNRDNPAPFGGVQMVFFGDLFQLPPVVATPEEQHFFQTYYESPYFFSAKVLNDPYNGFEWEGLELGQVYRQKARHFIRLLDAVRLGTCDYDDLADLNTRHQAHFNSDDYSITLSTRNAIVDSINNRELSQLSTPEMRYLGEVSGHFDPKQFPTEGVLRLKEGAQVMFIKNDPKRDYVNGTIGRIVKLEAERIVVAIQDKNGERRQIEVSQQTWEILRYTLSSDTTKIETETIGSFKQYPLKLAWAVTIHKSQGSTFDRVVIDLSGGAFEHGQTYVALSRCRTLEGIVLKQPIQPKDIITDPRIIEFYETHFR